MGTGVEALVFKQFCPQRSALAATPGCTRLGLFPAFTSSAVPYRVPKVKRKFYEVK
jgi:hypothetical protein